MIKKIFECKKVKTFCNDESDRLEQVSWFPPTLEN